MEAGVPEEKERGRERENESISLCLSLSLCLCLSLCVYFFLILKVKAGGSSGESLVEEHPLIHEVHRWRKSGCSLCGECHEKRMDDTRVVEGASLGRSHWHLIVIVFRWQGGTLSQPSKL